MYIIGKNKDYYDGVAGSTGIDKTIVYEREFVEYDNKLTFPEPFKYLKREPLKYRNKFHTLSYYNLKNDVKKYVSCAPFIVGFCGKLYVGWKFQELVKEFTFGSNKYSFDYIYDENVALSFIEGNRWGSNITDDLNHINNYDPIKIFRELNTPYFIFDPNPGFESKTPWHNPRFYVNPQLKKYEFYKVFDSYMAFQEIQMFISGVLGTGEKNIVEVDDKYKIAGHGFDKWSFRKEPSKNKKRRS